MEGGVLDRIPVDLADIKVFLHLFHVAGWDAVRGAVDSLRRCCRTFFAQRCPEGTLDQRDDSAW